MKKTIVFAAALSLAAPAAFGQTGTQRDFVERQTGPMGNVRGDTKTEIVFLPAAADAPQLSAMVAALRNELRRSRQLDPLFLDDNRKIKLLTGGTVEMDAAGDTMTVKFRLVDTPRRQMADGEATCAVTKPSNCARDIVVRAETFVRTYASR